MLKNSFFFFILCLGISFNTQASLDSTILVSLIDKQILDQNLLSPTFSQSEKLESYGKVDLKYSISTGDLRKAQQSYTYKSPEFFTEGYAKLDRFRIAARFSFNKIFEDSLAFGQRNNLDDLTAVYAYAAKSMSYERQNYSANTSFRFDFHPFFSASLNLDYLKHWSVGQADPRLKSDVFQLKLSPGIIYNSENHSLGLQGVYGRGDEQFSLQYKNREYQTSLLYPDRIHYINYGYGSSVIKDSSTIEKYENIVGAKLHYELRNKKNSWRIFGEYEKGEIESFNQKRSSNQNQGPIAILYSHEYMMGLTFHQKEDFHENYAFIDVYSRNVYDGNLKTSGNLGIVNYEASVLSATMGYYFKSLLNAKQSWELGGKLGYHSEERIDRSSSVFFNSQSIISEIPFQYSTSQKEMDWILGINLRWKLPIQQEIEYSSYSLSEFVKQVVFTDYYYEKLNQYALKFHVENIRWGFNQNKQKLGIFTDIEYLTSNSVEEENLMLQTRKFSGNRFNFQIGLRLHLLNP